LDVATGRNAPSRADVVVTRASATAAAYRLGVSSRVRLELTGFNIVVRMNLGGLCAGPSHQK
ncbi:MAG: hypothetical protein AAGC72_13375, partial [Planctomycetota bacterium]